MINVAALTLGERDPSSRFRVRQFIEPLRRRGIKVAEHKLPLSEYRLARHPPLGLLGRLPGVLAARRNDVTWLRRELISGRKTLEPFAGRKRIFDVDDAIWLAYGSSFSERIAEDCYGVIAGNEFIADHYCSQGAPRVWVVPTCVDTDIWRPAESDSHARRPAWTIGWIGTWSNVKYLRRIEGMLADFLAAHAESRLLVVCDRAPAFERLPPEKWRFRRWTQNSETSVLREMDVGLMPLDDSEWVRGKCAFKMLTYMATGLPVVVTPIGVNDELLRKADIGFGARTDDEWHRALQALYADRGRGARMGAAGRRVVEEGYSVRGNVGRLAEIFEIAARA